MSHTDQANPVDPCNLQRFVDAQRTTYKEARLELSRGDKIGHWMWYIFPQLRGLGLSSTSEFYGISGANEALAYLGHAVLGPRLIDCTKLANSVQGRSAGQIFSSPDYLKFCSCMTLFHCVSQRSEFFMAIEKYFDGQLDLRTVDLLSNG